MFTLTVAGVREVERCATVEVANDAGGMGPPRGRGVVRPERLPDHMDLLFRAAWALCGSPHDAEDLVQETYARVLARPRLLHRREELPYLLKVLRNTFLTSLRTAGRRPRTVAMPPDESHALRSSLAEPEVAAEQRELLAVIAELPDDFREALVAVDIVGVSYREAARALGTTEATITSRLYRARERVARAFGGEPPRSEGKGSGSFRSREE
jgi:RNA polymerase sigma-70 factor (ECF subfamily)